MVQREGKKTPESPHKKRDGADGYAMARKVVHGGHAGHRVPGARRSNDELRISEGDHLVDRAAVLGIREEAPFAWIDVDADGRPDWLSARRIPRRRGRRSPGAPASLASG